MTDKTSHWDLFPTFTWRFRAPGLGKISEINSEAMWREIGDIESVEIIDEDTLVVRASAVGTYPHAFVTSLYGGPVEYVIPPEFRREALAEEAQSFLREQAQ
jgi:hypothetical protein